MLVLTAVPDAQFDGLRRRGAVQHRARADLGRRAGPALPRPGLGVVNATRHTILVDDDEALPRRMLERWLSLHDYRAIGVGSAETAYELVASERPDALLLDSRLPPTAGLALYLAIVRRWPALGGRIGVMTGDAEAHEVRAWLERHRCTVIRTPVDLDAVSDWLRAVLRPERLHQRGGAGA